MGALRYSSTHSLFRQEVVLGGNYRPLVSSESHSMGLRACDDAVEEVESVENRMRCVVPRYSLMTRGTVTTAAGH